MVKAKDTLAFVLVVDQEPALLRLLSLGLAPHGFRVHPATSRQEAVAILATSCHAIDIALIDQRPYSQDGLVILRELRQLKPTLRCCMMGCTIRGEKERILAAGAAGFLPKPFRLEEVATCVRNLHKEVLAGTEDRR